jgi:hypothetical protein
MRPNRAAAKARNCPSRRWPRPGGNFARSLSADLWPNLSAAARASTKARPACPPGPPMTWRSAARAELGARGATSIRASASAAKRKRDDKWAATPATRRGCLEFARFAGHDWLSGTVPLTRGCSRLRARPLDARGGRPMRQSPGGRPPLPHLPRRRSWWSVGGRCAPCSWHWLDEPVPARRVLRVRRARPP